jgi:hypothetical protein
MTYLEQRMDAVKITLIDQFGHGKILTKPNWREYNILPDILIDGQTYPNSR